LSSFEPSRFLSLLKTRRFGREFHFRTSLDSTSTFMKELAAGGCAEGALALADHQSAGRGRWGRSWESAAGKNLLFSFLVRPKGGMPSQLSAVFGLACLRALGTGKLKWPNDIWIGGRKLCGMLIEEAAGALVVGIGVNVNQSSEEFPEEIKGQATSLAIERGAPLEREALLAEILAQCEDCYGQWREGGFDLFRGQWNENALFMGENVRCGAVEGKLLGLDQDGGLLVESRRGVEKLVSGEVFGLRPVLD
jgi:BirA family biotin operon repressor/biotin-[acetyl-CoA-carboxylase] ligase